MNRNIFVILILAVLFVSCDDVFDPAIENNRDKNTTYVEPNFGQGLLTQGYARIPSNNWSFNDVATDDAVTNITGDGYRAMATGSWTASVNATDRWSSCLSGIQYLNLFLSEVNKMTFAKDANSDKLFKDRMTGEAFGLRALLMYNLLQAHAGWVKGKLLGFPIFLTEQTLTSDFNLPRADFNKCVERIYNDIDSAQFHLPLDYKDLANNAAIPSEYQAKGVADYSVYNLVLGQKFTGLMSGRIMKAIRSQVALLAASQAYTGTDGSTGTWEDAAKYAAEVLKLGRPIAAPTYGLAPYASGVTWFNNSTEINALTNGANTVETIWRAGTSNNRDLETQNYPPTLNGQGRINPTQNLVDAFPMANGYPKDLSAGTSKVFDPSKPYDNRDPRLKAFVLVNGATLRSTTINMTSGDDAVNAKPTSSRTSYYMLKLLRQDVNVMSVGANTQLHYKPRIRYTEIYLNYAEAANEAWGPKGDPMGYGFSAYDIIKAIRSRALNITNDPYLETISDKDAMRTLIRNERRLELCFEGFRFWDLRRWKVNLSELNAPALGITLSGTVSSPVFSAPSVVESRVYGNYMYYGPIPYGETVKWSNLLQNDGWK